MTCPSSRTLSLCLDRVVPTVRNESDKERDVFLLGIIQKS